MHCSKMNNNRSVRSVFSFQSQVRRQTQSPSACEARSPIRLSRLMALAIRFEDLLRCGEVAGYSELAARYGVDRGRISRIMHLRLLAPDLQEKLLSLDDASGLSLKQLLPVCKIVSWQVQRKRFRALC